MIHSAVPGLCEIGIELHQQVVLMDSGRSFTQMGLFEDCLAIEEMKFGFLAFLNKTTSAPLGIQTGLCLPQVCTEAEIQKFADAAFKNASISFQTHYIESPQDFSPKFTVAFYFAAVILLLCLIAIVISTFSEKLSKKSHILGAFNLKKSTNVFIYREHKFNVFNGIKSLCMMWVILGHMYSVRIQNTVNLLTIEPKLQVPFFLLVLAAFFAVDVFFYIGGFLVAYSFLRNKMKSVIKYPLAIVHRILRFWPSYLMAILFYYGIFLHTGHGPLWFKVETAGQLANCSGMWKTLFFVDNIVDNGQKMCMGWGWYLQNDMQIFIFSIPILYLYSVNRKASFIVIWVTVALSLLFNFLEAQINQFLTVAHRYDFAKWNTYFPNVYIKPWTRCPPYLYGLTLGLLYMEFMNEQKTPTQKKGFFMKLKQKLESSRTFKNVFQLIGLAIILFIVLIPRTLQVGHKWPQVAHSFYLTFTKLFFVIGVSMLTTPSLVGIKNDLFFFLMDTVAFNFISKISFWTYLIHYMFVLFINYSQKVDFYYNVSTVFAMYVPVVILSMIGGLFGTLIIEVPFAKIQKLLFEPKKKEKVEVSKDQKELDIREKNFTLINSQVMDDAESANLTKSTEK